jgi:hypothetical protein
LCFCIDDIAGTKIEGFFYNNDQYRFLVSNLHADRQIRVIRAIRGLKTSTEGAIQNF